MCTTAHLCCISINNLPIVIVGYFPGRLYTVGHRSLEVEATNRRIKVFYWEWVRGICWPITYMDVLVILKHSVDAGGVRSGIVVLENGVVLADDGQGERAQYLISVSDSIQITHSDMLWHIHEIFPSQPVRLRHPVPSCIWLPLPCSASYTLPPICPVIKETLLVSVYSGGNARRDLLRRNPSIN